MSHELAVKESTAKTVSSGTHRRLELMTDRVDVLVFLCLLFDVTDSIGQLLQIVLVVGVLLLQLCVGRS